MAISLAKNTKTFHKLPNNTFGLLAWYDQAIVRKAEREAKPIQEPNSPKVAAKTEGI